MDHTLLNETTTTASTGSNSTSLLGNGISNCLSWPNYQGYYYSSPPIDTSFIRVEKCENGFIVTKNYKRFVINKPEDILKYFKDEK